MDEKKYQKIRSIIKTTLNKMYYIGGSVVLISLIFKFTNTRGSDVMLIVGLLTEALIFFLGAFDTDDTGYEGSNNIPQAQQKPNFFSECNIDINKYYEEINRDMKKITFKIQSFEMIKKIQNILSENNDDPDDITKEEQFINDFKKSNLYKKEHKKKNININKVINNSIKRGRGRPRKNQL